MVKSMFAGVAGLRAHQQKMDVIGNNIANVKTWGFKGATTSFKESMYQTVIQSSAGSSNTGALGGTNSSQVGYGSQVSSIKQNFTQGNYAPTDSPLDCMISGSGFFLVGAMPEGSSAADRIKAEVNPDNLKLSRVGDFELKAVKVDGKEYTFLTDSSGNYVFGVPASELSESTTGDSLSIAEKQGDKDKVQMLVLPEITNDKYSSFTIDETGVLTATTELGKSYVVGRIVMGSVANPGGMTNIAGPYYTSGGSSGKVELSDCGTSIGSLVTGGLEMALVDLSTEMSNMITTQRGFQANSKIITVTDSMLEELVNMKR